MEDYRFEILVFIGLAMAAYTMYPNLKNWIHHKRKKDLSYPSFKSQKHVVFLPVPLNNPLLEDKRLIQAIIIVASLTVITGCLLPFALFLFADMHKDQYDWLFFFQTDEYFENIFSYCIILTAILAVPITVLLVKTQKKRRRIVNSIRDKEVVFCDSGIYIGCILLNTPLGEQCFANNTPYIYIKWSEVDYIRIDKIVARYRIDIYRIVTKGNEGIEVMKYFFSKKSIASFEKNLRKYLSEENLRI